MSETPTKIYTTYAVLYCRYSCDRQNEQSIDGQIRVCSEFAERNNIKIVGTYIDKAMSGTNDNRDDFQRMLRDSDRKQWQYVIVYKLDRFSRNKYEMAIHRKHLKDNGVKILSAMENIPDSPEGILLESLLEGMNQYYSEELSQKTKRGLNESRLKGNFCGGKINYGYSLLPVYLDENNRKAPITHKVIINEEEAPIVKEIFTEYANGKSVCQLVKELNERGIKNRGNPFITSTLYTMLKREKYTGIYRIGGNIYDKLYPPIVPIEVYEIVQKRLYENNVGKHVPDVSYILRGKLDCGYCGKRLTSFGGQDRYGRQWRYYRCYGTKGCVCKSVKKELIEGMVIDALNKAVCSEENIELLINAILAAIDKKNADNITLRVLEKELEKTEKSIANIMTAIKMGIITETTKESLEECEATKREITAKLFDERAKEKPKPSRDEIRKYIHAAFNKPSKQMIDLLVQKVVVYNDHIEITFKYVKGSPTDERPKKLNKHLTKNMSLDVSRGSLFMSYDYPYTETKHYVTYDKICTVKLYV